jgi:hypothetical protein
MLKSIITCLTLFFSILTHGYVERCSEVLYTVAPPNLPPELENLKYKIGELIPWNRIVKFEQNEGVELKKATTNSTQWQILSRDAVDFFLVGQVITGYYHVGFGEGTEIFYGKVLSVQPFKFGSHNHIGATLLGYDGVLKTINLTQSGYLRLKVDDNFTTSSLLPGVQIGIKRPIPYIDGTTLAEVARDTERLLNEAVLSVEQATQSKDWKTLGHEGYEWRFLSGKGLLNKTVVGVMRLNTEYGIQIFYGKILEVQVENRSFPTYLERSDRVLVKVKIKNELTNKIDEFLLNITPLLKILR